MSKKTSNDVFAEIAGSLFVEDNVDMSEIHPPVLFEKYIPAARSAKHAFRPKPQINTDAQLKKLLNKERKKHQKFLKDVSPKIPKTRTILPVQEFQWRVQDDKDRADFQRILIGKGKWKTVTIPHYDGPLGSAVTFYRTELSVPSLPASGRRAFLCFKGVDYKTQVFLNNTFMGAHEGFFAPFELDCTDAIKRGKNILVVRVENDIICMGNKSWQDTDETGDKIYAATGPGYDDPEIGWHHCPPGMGIYQDVCLEIRPEIFIKDIFVRPMLDLEHAEVRMNIYSCLKQDREASVTLSVCGRNFRKQVFSDQAHSLPNPVGPGDNYYTFSIRIPNARIWSPETPWLYSLTATVTRNSKNRDIQQTHFGMRNFRMDYTSRPKGKMYLNNQEIRLRGTNTMGHLQQCVIKRDWTQLIKDILLYKICNMNFMRLTQRPVQDEIYTYCDMLGMMTQTDFPIFGVLRKNQFSEAVRQTGEMERLVRNHPCNIMVTYVNEPTHDRSPAKNKNRSLTKPEMLSFFQAADQAVRLENPDRVIKPVDGDYHPPSPGLPDNHCYCGWYNGHGLDIGRLHKGYWLSTKTGWHIGCGEFGAEGLDSWDVMKKHYPKEWLPASTEEEHTWTPDRIVRAQTGRFHYMWFETRHTVKDWIRASLEHQAWVIRLMTEAFRRNAMMNTCAIHLGIDAFPSGWMKTIMGVDRKPKPAYFEYRRALAPLALNLRTDRYTFLSGEQAALEAWVCNDRNNAPSETRIQYFITHQNKTLCSGRTAASVPVNSSTFQGFIRFNLPQTTERETLSITAALMDGNGKILAQNRLDLEVFPRPQPADDIRLKIVGRKSGPARRLAKALEMRASGGRLSSKSDLILIDDMAKFKTHEKTVTSAVRAGARAVLLELPPGTHSIGGSTLENKACGMRPVHFAACQTGHELVEGFRENDFKFWHNTEKDMVTPLLESSFSSDGFETVLGSGNIMSGSGLGGAVWGPTIAVGRRPMGNGDIIVCQLKLADYIRTNPVAAEFASRLVCTG